MFRRPKFFETMDWPVVFPCFRFRLVVYFDSGPPAIDDVVEAWHDFCAIARGFVVEGNTPLDTVAAFARFEVLWHIEINVPKECGVTWGRKFCVVRIADQSGVQVRAQADIYGVVREIAAH